MLRILRGLGKAISNGHTNILQQFSLGLRGCLDSSDPKEHELTVGLSIVRQDGKDNIYLNIHKVKFRDLIVNHITS